MARGLDDPTLRRAMRLGDRAAARVVLRQLRVTLGVVATARVLARIAWARTRGRPFASLGPVVDERDRLSRRQCGSAVLLYRALRSEASAPQALALTREAVLAGGMPFLDRMIPDLVPARLAIQAPALAERFFNAEGTATVVDERTFTFDVHRCRFAELLRAVDAAELAPLFCEVDLRFFDGTRRPVTLRRRLTIAGGEDRCDFRFEAEG